MSFTYSHRGSFGGRFVDGRPLPQQPPHHSRVAVECPRHQEGHVVTRAIVTHAYLGVMVKG